MKKISAMAKKIVYTYRDSRIIRFAMLLTVSILLAAVLVFWFESGTNTEFADMLDGFWWMIITFSTTGYGDMVPITTGGRIIAILIIFFGIVGAGLLSASMTSWLVDQNSRSRRGLLDFQNIRNHLVVCGWKQDIKEILRDILRISNKLQSDQIILVSNADPQQVDELKESDQLKGLKFVRGDYFAEHTLKRANVSQAAKVLILADTLDSNAVSEVDSKTVMTVLTVKSMQRETYVTAEVLDRKFESYLRHAQCDEIIFSRDFARQLLASSSSTNGMSHIIHELVSRENSSTWLTTIPVPENFVGKTYGEFRAYTELTLARNKRNVVMIGLLENTGSQTRMKLEALREAQKTSDVSRLVSNIQGVKGLSANHPRFLPAEDSVLLRYSAAIILEKESEEGRSA